MTNFYFFSDFWIGAFIKYIETELVELSEIK